MSSIMGQIEQEHPDLFALEFGKIAEYDFVYTIIYKYLPISTKLGQNVCDCRIWDEFNYGSNRTRTELCAIELENLPYLALFTL